jgi:hypothetical protein
MKDYAKWYAGYHLRWTWAGEDATCYVCYKPSGWIYMPVTDKLELGRKAACDEHVPRGYSCMEDELDELGRLLPCCEWEKK